MFYISFPLQKGWKSWGVQATESPITSWLLLASAVLFIFQAATAGAVQWAGYGKLFDESRFCHVTTIDFLALTASAPLWMWNDAEVRQWQSRCAMHLSNAHMLVSHVHACKAWGIEVQHAG